MPATLQVENLQKRYGDFQAVRGVSFAVEQGEIFGLLGPNGAGKTSTVECVVGLRRPDGGSIQLCGLDAIAQPEAVKERIGVALQSTYLQDKITPRKALNLFASFYRRPVTADGSRERPSLREKVGAPPDALSGNQKRPAIALAYERRVSDQLLERFSLREKADAPFDSLSGGQKQRLAIALAFVNEPQVLFLDEPTTGLDPQSRRELHQAILQMRAEGRTVLLTTHYIEEAHALCDRIAIIDHGKVIAEGKPDDLIAKSKATPRIAVQTKQPLKTEELSKIAGVEGVEANGDGIELKTSRLSHVMIELVRLIESQGNELIDLHIRRPTLEDVFIELTGSKLRE